MDLKKIPTGLNPPHDVFAVIEVPLGGVPVKYEFDKTSHALYVDRFLHTAMFYPGNYGFVPHTLSDDGDPCDIMVITPVPVVPGSVIRCRPVGALLMEDEAGNDEKIVAVPVDKLHPFYKGVTSYRDLPDMMCEQIAHFFQHYKDLEKGKWVSIVRWLDAREAEQLIADGMKRFKSGGKLPKAKAAKAAKAAKKPTASKSAAAAKAKLKAKPNTTAKAKGKTVKAKKAKR